MPPCPRVPFPPFRGGSKLGSRVPGGNGRATSRDEIQGRSGMARKETRTDVNRRKFLAGAAVATTAATVANGANAATPGAAGNKRLPSAAMPTYREIAAETGGLREPTTQLPGRPASDFMVDVLKSLKIEYIYSNPASSFRGIHESLINYGKNTMPEFLTVTHEGASVAMCHGHFKATGKP